MEFLEHWRQLEIAMENFKFKKDQSRTQLPGEGRLPCPSKFSGRGRPVPLCSGGLSKILMPEQVDSLAVGINGYDTPTSASALENISNEKEDQGGVQEVTYLKSSRVDDLQMKEVKLEKGCLEAEEEKERRISELSEEIKVLKETFSNKMCEMQKDLLAMVEHCLDFEKELSRTKDENRKMQSQIEELVEEREGRLEKEQTPGEEMSHEKATHVKKSTIEEVANSKSPGMRSNKCRIVTVSSGSLGTIPSPSKSPPRDFFLDKPQVLPPSPSSTKIMWHHPTSAPVYTPGPPRLPVYHHHGFSDQYLPTVVPPHTVSDQYCYNGAFYPYGPYTMSHGDEA